MRNIAIFASGSGSNFQAIAEAIERGEIPALSALLICDKEHAGVLERAKKLDIPAYIFVPKEYPNKQAYEAAILDLLQKNQVEWLVLAGYMRMVESTLLTPYRHRIVNIHPSLLPSFPGKDGILQAWNAGVKVTGVTVHYVDEGMDTGPIIAQVPVFVEREDTYACLKEKIHKKEHELYISTLQMLMKDDEE